MLFTFKKLNRNRVKNMESNESDVASYYKRKTKKTSTLNKLCFYGRKGCQLPLTSWGIHPGNDRRDPVSEITRLKPVIAESTK